MSLLLQLSFLFFIGCFGGWGMEVLYRRFCCRRSNPEHHWINPGFLTGPYLPLYGFGLTAMYLICSVPWPLEGWKRTLLIIAVITLTMTVIEYVAGLIFVKRMKLQLWDYSNIPGNIQGIICPPYTALWGLCGALYLLLVHPHIQQALDWFSRNLAFSFVVGFFYGVFAIDLVYTTQIVRRIRAFAEKNDLVVRYEELKAVVLQRGRSLKRKTSFLFAFRSSEPLTTHLERYAQAQKERYQQLQQKLRRMRK